MDVSLLTLSRKTNQQAWLLKYDLLEPCLSFIKQLTHSGDCYLLCVMPCVPTSLSLQSGLPCKTLFPQSLALI